MIGGFWYSCTYNYIYYFVHMLSTISTLTVHSLLYGEKGEKGKTKDVTGITAKNTLSSDTNLFK